MGVCTKLRKCCSSQSGRKYLNLQYHVIDPDLIGAHFLWVGRDMDLKTMGFYDSNIKKNGIWNSHTWEIYIHRKNAKLHKWIDTKMRNNITFHNIAFIEPPKVESFLLTISIPQRNFTNGTCI